MKFSELPPEAKFRLAVPGRVRTIFEKLPKPEHGWLARDPSTKTFQLSEFHIDVDIEVEMIDQPIEER